MLLAKSNPRAVSELRRFRRQLSIAAVFVSRPVEGTKIRSLIIHGPDGVKLWHPEKVGRTHTLVVHYFIAVHLIGDVAPLMDFDQRR